jgi:hypothetical protein
MSIHFGNASGTVVADYSRRLLTRKIFGLYAEVPVAIVPPLDLNYDQNQIPKDFRALFVTPSVRLNIFSSDSVKPWVSAAAATVVLANPQLWFSAAQPRVHRHKYRRASGRGGTGCMVLASVGCAVRSPRFLLWNARPEC